MVVWVMTEPIDLSMIEISDAPSIEPPDFIKPNHRASSGQGERDTSRAKTFFSSRGRNREPKEEKSKKPVPPNKPGQFIEPLEEFYNTVAVFLMPIKPRVAVSIMTQAHSCAEAWDEAAQKNESLRRVLFGLSVAGTWSKVFMAHAPIIAAVFLEKNEDTPLGDMLEKYMAEMGKGSGD